MENVLTDGSGRTRYTFAEDGVATGWSACSGGYAATWAPFVAPAGEIARPAGATGAFGTITRDDGTKQVPYAGQPLYRYAGDQNAGEAKGQGLVSGAWLVAAAQPLSAGTPAMPSVAAPAPAPTSAAGGEYDYQY